MPLSPKERLPDAESRLRAQRRLNVMQGLTLVGLAFTIFVLVWLLLSGR
jgi:hypothetical protein